MEKFKQSREDKPIPDSPKLRYIEKTLSFLESDIGPDGQEINWKNLYEKVGSWETGLELSNKARNIVLEYLASRIPRLKEKIPSISHLPEDKIIKAIGQGWFEELGEEIGGTRKEVLLAVLASILRKIETKIYKEIFRQASEEDFKKLGMPATMRNLLISLLDVSAKSSPLFIRFLAYSQIADKPDKPSPIAPLGQDGKPHTLAELFPHETQFISKKLKQITESEQEWGSEPNVQEFREYMMALSDFFSETDTEKAQEQYDRIVEKGERLISTEFPILVSPPTGSYYMPPYADPELRLAIRTPESSAEEEKFKPLQDQMASVLPELGVEEFSEEMRSRVIRSYISIGPHGAGITLNEPAETDKGYIVLYLNEQINKYDRGLKNFLPLVEGYEEVFNTEQEQQLHLLTEELSRDGTMMHEIAHTVYFEDTPEARRLGPDAETVIAEVAADAIANGIESRLISRGDVSHTKEQRAMAAICIPLQVIERSDPDDEYFKAAVFTLNALFEKEIVIFNGQKIKINDYGRLFDELENGSREIIRLYRDEKMSPEKAKKWIRNNCSANTTLQKLIEFIKKSGISSR